MDQAINYLQLNRESWNKRVEPHMQSDFYQMDAFRKGRNSLNSIEMDLLGNIQGLSVLHLQCHFGQDTLSLSRLGARATGIDLSDKAIDEAQKLATELQADARFICCDVYDTRQHVNELFDIVFTSYGTIGWLPDIDRWAEVIASSLAPGGRFIMVDFHPVVWMFDDDFSQVGHCYFNAAPIPETEQGTYADPEADISHQSIGWNHGMAEIISSLLQQGLTLQSFQEFDYSPYPCFRHTEEVEPGKFRIKHLENKIPMLYALVATKA